MHDKISYFQSDTSFCLRLFNTGLRTASNGVLMYLYLQRGEERTRLLSLTLMEKEAMDLPRYSTMLHSLAAGSEVKEGAGGLSDLKLKYNYSH